jgi:hypothetical protein
MTDVLTKEAARSTLENDALRRVVSRAAQLAFSGSYGAVLVLLAGFTWAPFQSEPGSVPLHALADAAVPFAMTVDPVLPTLVTALLALSVVKAGKFAPRFVVGTAALCGFFASSWAVLSLVALFAERASERGLSNNAVAGVGLGVVAVAVTVVLMEVLPLSNRPREKLLTARLLRAEELLTRARRRYTRLTRRYNQRPYRRPATVCLIGAWYLATVAAGLGPVLLESFGVWGRPDWLSITWSISGVLTGLMLLSVLATHAGLRYPLVLKGWSDENAITLGMFGSIALVLVGSTIGIAIWLLQLFEYALGPVAITSTVWIVVFLMSATVPLVSALPKWGLFGQVALASRIQTLQVRRDRLRRVHQAAAIDAAPAEPARSARWFDILRRRCSPK